MTLIVSVNLHTENMFIHINKPFRIIFHVGNNGMLVKTPGFMPFLRDAQNYRFETVPQKGLNGRVGYQPRGRGLGGSSAINAMIYIRGNRYDYDNWAALGCDGWSYDDVLPYFKRAEHNVRGDDAYHGASGPLWVSDQSAVNPGSHAFVEAATQLQLPHNRDFNGAKQEGFGLYQVTQKDGERWSASRGYVEPLRKSRNLDVRIGVTVQKVEIDDGRVTGVTYSAGDRQRTVRARGGVVMSAGAFNSPQILMLSGVGPGDHLSEHGITVQRDCNAVGSDLQDHIDYVSSWQSQDDGFFGDSLKGTMRMAKALIERGAFTEIFIPALQSKELALALQAHGAALPERARNQVRIAVRHLVRAAYLLDWYGDLGNKLDVDSAYDVFGSMVAEIVGVYDQAAR